MLKTSLFHSEYIFSHPNLHHFAVSWNPRLPMLSLGVFNGITWSLQVKLNKASSKLSVCFVCRQDVDLEIPLCPLLIWLFNKMVIMTQDPRTKGPRTV